MDKDSLDFGGSQIDPGKSAEELNLFFTSIGTTLAEGFDANGWVPSGPATNFVIEECSTTFHEVRKLCREIKIAKSSNLASKVLKDSFLALTNQLSFLFNLSLSTSIFPNDWKSATIVPLYKGGPVSEVGNYRPVSLLPLPGKLFLEKISTQNYQVI